MLDARLVCSFGQNQKVNIAEIIMTVTMTMTMTKNKIQNRSISIVASSCSQEPASALSLDKPEAFRSMLYIFFFLKCTQNLHTTTGGWKEMQQNFLAQPDSTTDKYMAKNDSILPAAFKGICRHFLSKSFYVNPTLHWAFL